MPKSTKAESNLVSKSVPFNLAGQSGNPKEIIKPTPSIIIGTHRWSATDVLQVKLIRPLFESPGPGANNPLPIQKNYSPAKPTTTRSPNKNASNSPVVEGETEDQAKLRQFLEDAIEVRDELNSKPAIEEESDNDEEPDQPKILGYQDELDEEDRIEGRPTLVLEEEASESPKNCELAKRDSIEESGDELKENGDQKKPKDESHRSNDRLNDRSNETKGDRKANGHSEASKESRRKGKESKISINLVDSLPDKSILESHSSKSKKSKKSKRSSKDGEKLSRKKSQNIDELLGPYVSPIDEGPTGNEDEYFAL